MSLYVSLPYLSPMFVCLASLASRSASLGFCCYLDICSGYVGRLTHVSSMDNVVNKLLQLKFDVG